MDPFALTFYRNVFLLLIIIIIARDALHRFLIIKPSNIRLT